jgi:hypothetical protein
MVNQYVISKVKAKKFISLDFHDGSEVIQVDNLSSAYFFSSKNEAVDFATRNSLNLKAHKLFKIELTPRRTDWH